MNGERIFVDLDGTLVRTDLFLESILVFVKRNPLNIIRVITWILHSRAYAKERLAEFIDIDVSKLPYEPAFVQYLAQSHKEGRSITLVTATHRRYAEQVADYLGFFDGVIATHAGTNLKGKEKLKAILKVAGNDSFSYAGDSAADRSIWQAAATNILVNAPHGDVKAARLADRAELVIQSRPRFQTAFLQEMRPHQYAKNALIFVPLFTSHAYQDVSVYFSAVLAFVCFCLCASGAYFLNDLLDLQSDRLHVSKRSRPLASGDLPLAIGIPGAILLPLIAFGLALAVLPVAFFGVLLCYFAITNVYSFYLKSISTVDVMTLAILYTMRIVAGAVALDITLSSWLMAFSIFLFVSLAYLKRYIEVSELSESGRSTHGRGYDGADSETMFSLGTANITAAVVVLALYVNSEEVVLNYQTPEILWLLCLLLLYWGNRLWVGARRGKIADDPIIFAVKDRVSRIVGAVFIIVVLSARYVEI